MRFMRCTTVSIQSLQERKKNELEISKLLPYSINVDVYVEQQPFVEAFQHYSRDELLLLRIKISHLNSAPLLNHKKFNSKVLLCFDQMKERLNMGASLRFSLHQINLSKSTIIIYNDKKETRTFCRFNIKWFSNITMPQLKRMLRNRVAD